MIKVWVKQGLLGQNVAGFDLPSDSEVTPRMLLARCQEQMPRSLRVQVAVDGTLLEDDEQLDTQLRDGQQVIFLPETGGGIDIVTIILIIALSTAVNYVAGLLAPRPRPPGVAQERGDESSQTYAWDGIKTNYGPGLPIPWAYGRHALGGQVIWTDSEASRAAGQAVVDDRLRMILSLCEGPIYRIGDRLAYSLDALGGLSGGTPGPQFLAEVRVNGNLIDNTLPLPGARAWIRPGTQDQPPIPAPFAGVSQIFSPAGQLSEQNDEVIFTFLGNEEVSGLTFVFAFPGGLYQINQTGAYVSASVTLITRWRPVGATTWQQNLQSGVTIAGSFAGYHAHTVHVGLGSAGSIGSLQGPIEIGVKRISQTLGAQSSTNCVWRDLSVMSPHVLRYPLEALLALELAAGAKFTGGLPQVTVRCELALVRVWDAVNGWSPRCWDVPAAPFNFNTHAPGRNPAWCLLDFLLARWGLGHWITEENIDLPAFRRWAAFCDEDPNPADPWGEPQFAIDLVGDQPRPVWEWVLAFCAAGRATPVMRNGRISVVYQYRDAHSDSGVSVPAKTPVQLITSGTCEDVQVNWLSKKNRTTIYQFQFLDEEQAYTQDVFPVEDNDGSLNDPTAFFQEQYRPEPVQAYGITRKSQLFREGKWRHRIQRQVTRELQFATGPWALAAEVGDLIEFEHESLRPFDDDVPINMQVVAEDLGADPPTLTVDHHLAGTGLQIVVRDPEGKPQRSNIEAFTNSVVDGRQRSLVELTEVVDCVVGATCVVGKIDKLVQTYEIVSITLTKGLKRQVRAIEWTPAAYDPLTEDEFLGAVSELDTDLDDMRAVDEPDTDALPPSVLGFRLIAEPVGGHTITWGRPASKVSTWARVFARPEDLGVWVLLGVTQTDELRTNGLRVGVSYVLSICLENRNGEPVPPDLGDLFTVVPEEFSPRQPPAPTNVRAEILDEQLLIAWDDAAHEDLDYFEVRAGSNWAAGEVLARERAPRAVLDNPPGAAPFMVAARSVSGLYSQVVVLENPGWSPPNQALVLNENDLSPSPAGTHTNTQWNATDLVIELVDGALAGSYESVAQDIGYQAPFYWQVRIDREEFHDLTVAELDCELGSGESHWHMVAGRPASPSFPGLDWRLRVADLEGLVMDLPPTLLATGHLGVVGTHTQVFVESRFHVNGSWTPYQQHLDRVIVARQMQVRLTFGRRSLRYRARAKLLAYAAYL